MPNPHGQVTYRKTSVVEPPDDYVRLFTDRDIEAAMGCVPDFIKDDNCLYFARVGLRKKPGETAIAAPSLVGHLRFAATKKGFGRQIALTFLYCVDIPEDMFTEGFLRSYMASYLLPSCVVESMGTAMPGMFRHGSFSSQLGQLYDEAVAREETFLTAGKTLDLASFEFLHRLGVVGQVAQSVWDVLPDEFRQQWANTVYPLAEVRLGDAVYFHRLFEQHLQVGMGDFAPTTFADRFSMHLLGAIPPVVRELGFELRPAERQFFDRVLSALQAKKERAGSVFVLD
jgi:hypothetical protein